MSVIYISIDKQKIDEQKIDVSKLANYIGKIISETYSKKFEWKFYCNLGIYIYGPNDKNYVQTLMKLIDIIWKPIMSSTCKFHDDKIPDTSIADLSINTRPRRARACRRA